MLSHQVLAKGDESAILEPDRLVVTTTSRRKEIPLAVVREVRRDTETSLKVVLTDGADHWIHGGNPTATTLFHDALTAALPEERDPAGSALITVEELAGVQMWWLIAGGAAFVGAYVAYVWWTGAAHGPEMGFIGFFAAFGTLMGLGCVVIAVSSIIDRTVLARRGITVVATSEYFPNGKKSDYYKFTDTHGNEYSQHAPRRPTRNIHVVYDPMRPGRHAARAPLVLVVLKNGFGLLGALALLALGLWGVLAPYL
ncbi:MULTISPECIES: hypothetical protein [unclassified Streptomyces]|uniref:hypothetical protein n=1 Tax=unclassified Streptomyces TaxID=2593676 RepID=UPI003D71EAB2